MNALLLSLLLAFSPKSFASDEFKLRFAELMKCGTSLGLQDKNGVIVAKKSLTKDSYYTNYHYGILNGNPSAHICTLEGRGTKVAVSYPDTAVSNPNLQSHLVCNLDNNLETLESLRSKIGKQLEYLQTATKDKARSALEAIEVCRDIKGLETEFAVANNSLRATLDLPPDPKTKHLAK